jgi:PPOX class probable F420-dependent enzyme
LFPRAPWHAIWLVDVALAWFVAATSRRGRRRRIATVAELPRSAQDLIASGVHAHLATINPDGTPQITMVWATVDEGEICVASLTPRQKLRNVARDPRVTVSFESPDRDEMGLRHYLVVYGRARVTEGGAPAFLRRLAPRYLGPDVKFPRGDDPPEGWVMRIAPERWLGHGPWAA